MMEAFMVRELYFVMVSILVGFGFSFFYDQFVFLRKILKHFYVMIVLEDLIYLAICFCISFVLLHDGNDGILRFYMILGVGIGVLCYTKTIGKVYVKGLYRLYCLIKIPVNQVRKLLTRVLNAFKIKGIDRVCTRIKRWIKHENRQRKKGKSKVFRTEK